MVYMSEKICNICSRKISLNNNQAGLVFDDKHFVCEDCCSNHTKDQIKTLTKTVMHTTEEGMPIGLWLIHEQNKDKTMMTVKK